MMKQLLFALALCGLFACEEDTLSDTLKPEKHTHEGIALAGRAPRIDICHYDEDNDTWKLITVNENAWRGHQKHGDVRLDDQDNDGFVPDNACDFGDQGDCDDLNPDVNPGAVEICDNSIDDDCDGLVDADDDDCATGCVDGEIEVTIDPDGTEGSGDEYTVFVHPTDNSAGAVWGEFLNDIDALPNFGTLAEANDDFNGLSNTNAIVAELADFNGGGYAARICDDLSDQSGCDWYLPSKGELAAIAGQLGPAGNNGFVASNYWSSTEANLITAYFQGFGTEVTEGLTRKNSSLRCRCIRREAVSQ